MKQVLTKKLISDLCSNSEISDETKGQLILALNRITLKEYVDWEVAHELSRIIIFGNPSASLQKTLLKTLIGYHLKGFIIKGAPYNFFSVFNKPEKFIVINRIIRKDFKDIYSLNNNFIKSEKLLALYRISINRRRTAFEIYNGNNIFLYEIMLDFCASGYLNEHWSRVPGSYLGIKNLITNFEQGLDKQISNITDIDDFVIRKKIQQIANLEEETSLKTSSIRTLFKLIDYLEDTFSQIRNTFKLYNRIVRCNTHLPRLLANNFILCSYPVDDELILTTDKFIVYLQDLNKISNKHDEISFRKVDCSKCNLYRAEFKKYILKNSPLRLCDGTISGTLIALNLLRDVKIKNGTIKQQSVLIDDCLYFMQEVNNSSNSTVTKKDLVGYLRRFLEYINNNHLIQVEKSFKEHLRIFVEPISEKKQSIKRCYLDSIEKILLKNAATSKKDALIYGAFELMLRTEMRANQILHLKKSNILINEINNTVSIKAISKTSKGKEITYSYGIKILKIIKNCIDNSVKNGDYLFGIIKNNRPAHLDIQQFRHRIKQLCNELKIPFTSPLRLRDTYMTSVMKYAIKNNLSDIQVKTLTGHATLSTTLNNYVDEDDFLISFLEKTYQIEIGKEQFEEIRPDLHIKNTVEISPEQNKRQSIVGNECGICSLKDESSCHNSYGGYSCLICKNFITTLKHKKYFENAIDNLSIQIKNSTDMHEKEELTAIKTICGIYLHEILKRGKSNAIN